MKKLSEESSGVTETQSKAIKFIERMESVEEIIIWESKGNTINKSCPKLGIKYYCMFYVG